MPVSAQPAQRRRVLAATVTPLASIFGSGFLIIVPLLERTLGSLSLLGAAAVCGSAWLAGTAIRHRIRVIEPLERAGRLDAATRRLDRAADVVIVVAYAISVALYVRIMAAYVVDYAGGPSASAERTLACATIAVITGIGVLRGFRGLNRLDYVALAAVLVVVTALIAALAIHDGRLIAAQKLTLPPGPSTGFGRALLVLGGLVISVQGFETVRYLRAQFDAETRVWASRVAQLASAAVYLALVALVTPVMGIGGGDPDNTLLDVTARIVPVLGLPLVLCAVLSQLSAATADTIAAGGDISGLNWMRAPLAYATTGAIAIALAATIPTLTIVVIASRAFAAYYALQALMALRTSEAVAQRLGYGLLALLMAAIGLLAVPAG